MQWTLNPPAIEIAVYQVGGTVGAAASGDSDPPLTIKYREVTTLIMHGGDVARLKVSNRNQVSPRLIVVIQRSLSGPISALTRVSLANSWAKISQWAPQ